MQDLKLINFYLDNLQISVISSQETNKEQVRC